MVDKFALEFFRDMQYSDVSTTMLRVKKAALKFMLFAQELELLPGEARLAANLMCRNAHEFLQPERTDDGKPAIGLIAFLETKGFQDVHKWDESALYKMEDALCNNNGRVPDIIDPATYTPPASGKE